MSDNLPKYKLIIFDIDGTMLDTELGILHAAEESLSIIGRTVSRPDIVSCIGPPLAKTLVKKGLLPEEDFTPFNETFRTLYKEKYLMEVEMYPDLVECLSKAKEQTKTAVATNKRFDYTHTLLDNLDLSKYFDVIKGTDFENRLKKSDLIMQCLEETGTSPSDAVMIGDTTSDRDAAEIAGVNFIAVTYGFGFKDSSENRISADSIKDLMKIIL